MSRIRTIAALTAPVIAAAGLGIAGAAPAQAAADQALSVELTDVREHGVGDHVLVTAVADVEVCLDELPAGDRDGVVYVTHDDFTLSQDGYEGREAKPWDGIDSEVITSAEGKVVEKLDDGSALPAETALAEGECVSGSLPFEIAKSDQVDPGTTALIFENDYEQREEFAIR